METTAYEQYERAKNDIIYGKEFEEDSRFEDGVFKKCYSCKDGSGMFWERTFDGITEYWSTKQGVSLYWDQKSRRELRNERDLLTAKIYDMEDIIDQLRRELCKANTKLEAIAKLVV